jgi:small-conductance mechanosensitive channel
VDAIELLERPLYGGTLTQWAVALGLAAVIVLVVALVKPILIRRLGAMSKHTRLALDDALVQALGATQLLLVAVVALDIGSQTLELPPRAHKLLDSAATVAVFLQIGLWLSALLAFWLKKSQAHAVGTNAGAATSLSAVGFVGRIVLWAVIALLTLDNLGINITTLIAGLGIGGIAVALAVQNILGDLFASLSIVIDKPFVIGDFIIVDNYMGTVEHVGLKTTRIRSLDGEQIVFSNSDLLKTRIRNYKRMYERRIVFSFGVTYSTPPAKLQKIPELVRGLIEGHKNVRFERSHFFRFGASSLDFETIYWVLTPDYKVYLDIQQAVNLALLQAFEQDGIAFAYPTQTLTTDGPLKVEVAAPVEPRERAPTVRRLQERPS